MGEEHLAPAEIDPKMQVLVLLWKAGAELFKVVPALKVCSNFEVASSRKYHPHMLLVRVFWVIARHSAVFSRLS